MCYNSFKPMKRRSRLSTEPQRVAGGGSATFRMSTNGPLRASGNAFCGVCATEPSVSRACV